MTKLGQCNPPPHPPPLQARLKKEKKRGRGMRMPSPDCVQGYKHGDAGAWFALSTGRYLYRVGARRAQTIVTCLSFPVVCDWWCLAMNRRPPYFFLKPSFTPVFSFDSCFLFLLPKILKEYVPKCSRLKWESTLVPMGDVKTVKVSKKSPVFPSFAYAAR